ncbi:hypothetical protein BDR26DRAFT_206149 [Obelidium mucronatum]|nr:hypothetical protein BDR26DRAFT_206149 [Obelidium mucronatum]
MIEYIKTPKKLIYTAEEFIQCNPNIVVPPHQTHFIVSLRSPNEGTWISCNVTGESPSFYCCSKNGGVEGGSGAGHFCIHQAIMENLDEILRLKSLQQEGGYENGQDKTSVVVDAAEEKSSTTTATTAAVEPLEPSIAVAAAAELDFKPSVAIAVDAEERKSTNATAQPSLSIPVHEESSSNYNLPEFTPSIGAKGVGRPATPTNWIPWQTINRHKHKTPEAMTLKSHTYSGIDSCVKIPRKKRKLDIEEASSPLLRFNKKPGRKSLPKPRNGIKDTEYQLVLVRNGTLKNPIYTPGLVLSNQAQERLVKDDYKLKRNELAVLLFPDGSKVSFLSNKYLEPFEMKENNEVFALASNYQQTGHLPLSFLVKGKERPPTQFALEGEKKFVEAGCVVKKRTSGILSACNVLLLEATRLKIELAETPKTLQTCLCRYISNNPEKFKSLSASDYVEIANLECRSELLAAAFCNMLQVIVVVLDAKTGTHTTHTPLSIPSNLKYYALLGKVEEHEFCQLDDSSQPLLPSITIPVLQYHTRSKYYYAALLHLELRTENYYSEFLDEGIRKRITTQAIAKLIHLGQLVRKTKVFNIATKQLMLLLDTQEVLHGRRTVVCSLTEHDETPQQLDASAIAVSPEIISSLVKKKSIVDKEVKASSSPLHIGSIGFPNVESWLSKGVEDREITPSQKNQILQLLQSTDSSSWTVSLRFGRKDTLTKEELSVTLPYKSNNGSLASWLNSSVLNIAMDLLPETASIRLSTFYLTTEDLERDQDCARLARKIFEVRKSHFNAIIRRRQPSPLPNVWSFPVNIKNAHWILLVFYQLHSKLYIACSKGCRDYEQIIEVFKLVLPLHLEHMGWPAKDSPIVSEFIDVADQRNDYDCGFHVLHHIKLIEADPEAWRLNPIVRNMVPSSDTLRLRVLATISDSIAITPHAPHVTSTPSKRILGEAQQPNRGSVTSKFKGKPPKPKEPVIMPNFVRTQSVEAGALNLLAFATNSAMTSATNSSVDLATTSGAESDVTRMNLCTTVESMARFLELHSDVVDLYIVEGESIEKLAKRLMEEKEEAVRKGIEERLKEEQEKNEREKREQEAELEKKAAEDRKRIESNKRIVEEHPEYKWYLAQVLQNEGVFAPSPLNGEHYCPYRVVDYDVSTELYQLEPPILDFLSPLPLFLPKSGFICEYKNPEEFISCTIDPAIKQAIEGFNEDDDLNDFEKQLDPVLFSQMEQLIQPIQQLVNAGPKESNIWQAYLKSKLGRKGKLWHRQIAAQLTHSRHSKLSDGVEVVLNGFQEEKFEDFWWKNLQFNLKISETERRSILRNVVVPEATQYLNEMRQRIAEANGNFVKEDQNKWAKNLLRGRCV